MLKKAAMAVIALLVVGPIVYHHFSTTSSSTTAQRVSSENSRPGTTLTPASASSTTATPATTSTTAGAPNGDSAKSSSGWTPSNATAPKIPLVPELTIVTAIAHPTAGDYESIKRIQAVNNDTVEIAYSSDIPGAAPVAGRSATPPRKSCKRSVLRLDLQDSIDYRENFCASSEESYSGATAIGVSSQTLNDLKSKGEADLRYQSAENSGDPDQSCVLKLVEKTDVAMPLLVNDRREQLPAVHARCVPSGSDKPSDFYFLDDADNPLALAWQLASANKLQVVKITIPTNTPRIEQALEQTGRAEVYGIYFDFGSASIRPESEPVLQEIADALKKNPAWKLTVEGHTDNVGGDSYNLDLSRRRAAAVRQSLVEHYKVA
ncbi:MAG TPA: OmpA family protein, partial [Candidatus Angelobacter sp.]|nr:OmpA family protein [Candidatus Angelobacter sp.]